jgi:polyphosphate glucokinase
MTPICRDWRRSPAREWRWSITLGTGVGCGLFLDGRLAPHLELGHIPFRKGQTFEEQLGNQAFLDIGRRRWNTPPAQGDRLVAGSDQLRQALPRRRQRAEITFELPGECRHCPERAGSSGGIGLWK